jgi:dTDP-3-amino-3,4,6-trideoxy-alpha-D-glucose transaminase
MGDGGELVGNGIRHEKISRALRNYGQTNIRYHHDHLGLNSRLDEVQAGILLYLLHNKLTYFIEKRREIARYYFEGIKNKRIKLLSLSSTQHSVWHLFPVFIQENRDSFVHYASEHGMQTAIHFPITIPKQRAMSDIPHEIKFPTVRAIKISETEVSLPIHPYMTNNEVNSVISICNSWFR